MTTTAAPAAVEQKVLSIDEMLSDNPVDYKEIPGFKPGTIIRIGSLDAGDMIEWSEANEGDAKRLAGLRMIVKSLVDKNGNRLVPQDAAKSVLEREVQKLKKLQHKKAEEIVKEVLALNGMSVKGDTSTAAETSAKNG